jgi:splicing factor 3B subunit 4
MNMVKLYGKPLRMNKAVQEKGDSLAEVGATLFIGNLDPMVDEKLLYDTFTAFGPLLKTPVISRDTESAESKGYGFIYYDNFESSDAALEAMNGQFLMNRCISVTYALKKDGKGERHGTSAGKMAQLIFKNVYSPHLQRSTVLSLIRIRTLSAWRPVLDWLHRRSQ